MPTANECCSFHLARATFERHNSGENRTPDIQNATPEILEYLNSPQWTFFIRIPKNVAEGNSRKFAMQYAHELAHHRQNLDCSVLVRPKEFLKSWKRSNQPQTEAERNPDELDAHRVALREFENIFGRSGLQSYIDNQCPKMQQFFVRLKNLLQEYEAYCQQGT